MSNRNMSKHNSPDRNSSAPMIDPNMPSLLRLALFLVIALVMSLTMPHDLFAYGFSGMLGFGAFISALTASFVREKVRAPHLTRWDESAVLMAISLLVGFFVDPQVIAQMQSQPTGG